MAFGKGAHFCAGAHLARLELRLMLKALLTRIEHIELAGWNPLRLALTGAVASQGGGLPF